MKNAMGAVVSLIGLVATSGATQAGPSITGTVDARPSKFLPDTVVYVKNVPGTRPIAQTSVIDQRSMTFLPHILIVETGDTVKFTNHDKVDHDVASPDGGYDLGAVPPGGTVGHTFKVAGTFTQICKLHPEMLAYVFVGQNRFATKVDEKGGFAIDNLPPGTYELDVWNPKLKAVGQTVTVSSSAPVTVKFSLTR